MELQNSESNQMIQTAIPDLLKLLMDEDLVIVQQASILLAQMSRIEILRSCLIETEQACELIVNCLNTTADIETARNLLSTLFGISINTNLGINSILKSNALDPLIKILDAPLDILVSLSISSLHNILLREDFDIKKQLCETGLVQKLISLLNKTENIEFLIILVDCLYLQTHHDMESKKMVYEFGGTHIISNKFMTKSFQNIKLDNYFIKLLKSLSVYQSNKPIIINSGILQKIGDFFSSKKDQNIQEILILLKNLSDQASKVNYLESLMAFLCNLLTTSETSVLNKQRVLCILANLTSNNENNKSFLIDLNIVFVLMENLHKKELIDESLELLKNLCHGSSKYFQVHEQMKQCGLEVLRNFFSDKNKIKLLVGIVKIMCKDDKNYECLKNCGLIDRLVFSLCSRVDLECIKLCSNCLLFLDKFRQYRDLIKKFLFVFKEMMAFENVEIQNIGFYLYCHFVED
ncbi:unnamed protein product [Brachionus calyciflorus]|uniref:Uncharacterized protein n=1 Tax=Brachionus calyciflorus TaxID=104777 RepID=A0A814G017_9BILA|nr:unnamed protein product [Brachionus calyciflorus]